MRKIGLSLIGLFILVVHLAPLYIALTVALKKKTDLSSRWLLPDYMFLDNFKTAFLEANLFRAFSNSLLITVVTSILIVLVGSMAAYPLSRIKSRANRWILYAVLAVMMIPTLSVIVPLYSLLVLIHGINTYWGIILVLTTYNLPLSIFVYANFIKTIPKELDEAATVDGCSGYSIFYRIILPQLKPVTAAVLILKGLKVWNDYEFALYFLQKPQKQTITLAISHFFSEYASNMNAASAAAFLAVIPVAAVFLFLQKYFVAGLTDGAVK
jgi:raffinose/stachyose/melibiose transport system permease protein